MTFEEIERYCQLFIAAGRATIPVPIAEWREYQLAMATKSIGKVDAAELAKGKVKPVVKRSVSAKIGDKAKADRREKRLRANREAKR